MFGIDVPPLPDQQFMVVQQPTNDPFFQPAPLKEVPVWMPPFGLTETA